MMIRAMRAGAAQVVRLPLQGDDFRAAMHRIAIQFGHPQGKSRTVVVFGSSEGSGCTTVALNLASELGRLRIRLPFSAKAPSPLAGWQTTWASSHLRRCTT